ncbi:MAG: [Clostridia bacterium]|nr:[FeFe] hydrogenase, group A [Clostridia bacterium]
CGQCTAVCPTGALVERDDTDKVWAALADSTKHVVVQTAPSIRATLGECFDMPIGTNVEGKMVAALRRLGFEKVFDTNTAADFTIVEEATELLDRVNNGGTLPMITSCSPGWVKFCELYYPEMTSHLSSCKSPQQMGGALIKTYWADKMGYDPKDIFVVSIMPCTAKKFEVQRADMSAAEGTVDVDVALTTRELARMISRAGIKFTALPDEEFDTALGIDTGAAVIFGATGGVMEAALRTANDVLTGKDNSDIEFHEVRGTEGLKEATYNIAGMDIKVCVASGAANAKTVMEKIASGEADWTFVEIMGCPGGCVNGGGQPIQPQHIRDTVDLKAVRAKALYDQDTKMEMRKSHLNPVIKEVYDNYFKGGYGCHAAHHALHTSYVGRKKYNI